LGQQTQTQPPNQAVKQTNKQTKTEQTKRFATRLKRPTNQPDQPDPTAPTLNCKPHTNTTTHTQLGGSGGERGEGVGREG